MKNMKCILSVMLSLGLTVSLTACGSSAAGESSQNAAETASPDTAEIIETSSPQPETPSGSPSAEEQNEEGSDILVIYFSRTGEQYTVGVIDHGNTAIVAEMIKEKTGADLFEILPADDHYPMTYAELTDIAKKEQNENARPEYAGEIPDLSQYSTIFIGSPVWWGDWPMIMYTFFEENAEALAGKNLVPFNSNEGSGLAGFDRKLASKCPDSTILKGLAVRGNDCQNKQDSVRQAVSNWITELGH